MLCVWEGGYIYSAALQHVQITIHALKHVNPLKQNNISFLPHLSPLSKVHTGIVFTEYKGFLLTVYTHIFDQSQYYCLRFHAVLNFLFKGCVNN